MRMPKMAVAAVAIAAATSVALPAGAANAASRGTLKICNEHDDTWVEMWADGPSHRESWIFDGDCESFKVRTGGYQIGFDWANIGNYDDQYTVATVSRNGHTSLRVFNQADITLSTNVQKNRKTTVRVNLFG